MIARTRTKKKRLLYILKFTRSSQNSVLHSKTRQQERIQNVISKKWIHKFALNMARLANDNGKNCE